jgi:hypothetical protein
MTADRAACLSDIHHYMRMKQILKAFSKICHFHVKPEQHVFITACLKATAFPSYVWLLKAMEQMSTHLSLS